ncbi:MAG: class I SAM-dependent methyltransferase [Kiritimatiellia bacterium]|jgi:SAM-dependent methyltransferase
MNTTDLKNLKTFYETEYSRFDGLTQVPENDDFMYSPVLKSLVPHLTKKTRVLDIGCNTGCMSLYMAKAGCNVTGIDLAQNAVDTATKSACHWNAQNVNFTQMDFLKDWQEPAVFDFVLCCHVIEHVPDDAAFLKKILFAMRPNGHLLLMAPTLYSSLYRVHKLFTGNFAWDKEVGHLRRYDRKTLPDLVEKAGFKIDSISFFDSVLREWFIILKPLRWTQKIWARRYIRIAFNAADKFLARFMFPATICIHARRGL